MSKAKPRIADASQHSTMYQWMVRNRVSFAAEVAEAGRPDWTRIAVILADMGLLDGRGARPSNATARLTWRKVRLKALPALKPSMAVSRETSKAPDTSALADLIRQMNERSGRKV